MFFVLTPEYSASPPPVGNYAEIGWKPEQNKGVPLPPSAPLPPCFQQDVQSVQPASVWFSAFGGEGSEPRRKQKRTEKF